MEYDHYRLHLTNGTSHLWSGDLPAALSQSPAPWFRVKYNNTPTGIINPDHIVWAEVVQP
jgi:hypothetical protein